MELVSAVITTYKREPQMVERALLSVLNQTYSPIEIIVVSDSPDDYELKEQVKIMTEKYSSVKYLESGGCKGACFARNKGIEVSQGKYIAFLDDDDEWLPNKIERQIRGFNGEKTGIVYSANYIIKNGQKQIEDRERHVGDVFEKLFKKNFIGSTSFPLCLKSAVIESGMFDVVMPCSQDYDLWLRITKSYKVNYIDEPLINYYMHEGDQITKKFKLKRFAYERIYSKHKEYLKSNKKAQAGWYLQMVHFCDCENTKLALKYWFKAFFLNPFVFKDLFFALKTFVSITIKKIKFD